MTFFHPIDYLVKFGATMNKKQREIIGQIRYLAMDNRHRVLIADEEKWMQEKMKEIRRLVKKLPYEKSDGSKKY